MGDGWKVDEGSRRGEVTEVPAPNPVLAGLGVDPVTAIVPTPQLVDSALADRVTKLEQDVADLKSKVGLKVP